MPQAKEEMQQIDDINQTEDVNMIPPQPGNFFITNIIRRTFASLFGWAANGPIRIGATTDGRLKVATTQGGFSSVEVINATGTSSFVTETFTSTAGQVDFMVTNYGLYIKTSPDGDTFGDEVLVQAGTVWSPPVSVKAFQIENSSSAGNGTVQAVGYY